MRLGGRSPTETLPTVAPVPCAARQPKRSTPYREDTQQAVPDGWALERMPRRMSQASLSTKAAAALVALLPLPACSQWESKSAQPSVAGSSPSMMESASGSGGSGALGAVPSTPASGGMAGGFTAGSPSSAGGMSGGAAGGTDGGADGGAPGAPTGAEVDVLAQILATAEGAKSEAPPTGVPSDWSWVAGATSTRTTPPRPEYTHANYWGALFRGESDVTPANTLVELRACSLWYLSEGSPTWEKADASAQLGGSTFSPTYASGGPEPQVLAALPTGIDVVPAPGYIYHFWQANSYQPIPPEVREILVNCQSRLSLRSATAADDRTQADYLIHVGADFRDPNDPNCANDSYICPSWGVGRFERVTSDWRNHTFHSLTQQDIDAGTPLPPTSLFGL